VNGPTIVAGPRVAILGGGPAGLGAALKLHELGRGQATLLEQGPRFGGNAGSFEWEGQRLDYGSHRLHPSCEPRILADLRRLLGGDLLERPRRGRIALRGRFLEFPLRPLDLLMNLPPRFTIGVARDAAARLAQFARLARRRAGDEPESFASLLRGRLGPTLAESFYFPYARKLWGLDAGEIAAVQARRRVSASTIAKLLRKVVRRSGRFLYPRRGYGQISEALAAAAAAAGARLLAGHRVTRLVAPSGERPWTVRADRGGGEVTIEADHLWSTLPIALLPALVEPKAPDEVRAAAAAVQYRALLLIYLRLPIERFSRYDAHYLPDADVAITRLSEPKNYSDLGAPSGATTLCAELPCDPGDRLFDTSDAELAGRVAADLARAGMALPVKPSAVLVVRLAHAYPVYRLGYERPLATLERWLETLPRLLSYGRQGLFAHDNAHHALAMAYAAVDCLGEKGFDQERWAGCRREFAGHVVED
jgi:protoporphyrinogen oxidase